MYFTCVHPQARGQGVMKGLWKSTIDAAREHGYKTITAQAGSEQVRQVLQVRRYVGGCFVVCVAFVFPRLFASPRSLPNTLVHPIPFFPHCRSTLGSVKLQQSLTRNLTLKGIRSSLNSLNMTPTSTAVSPSTVVKCLPISTCEREREALASLLPIIRPPSFCLFVCFICCT